MDETLTRKEAYQAVYGFLDYLWQSLSEEDQEVLGELDSFLSGMLLTDGERAADPALMELWHTAVAHTVGDECDRLSVQDAYTAMLQFLTLWSEPNSDGTLLGLCQELTRSGADREGWRQAVAQVRQGAFDPYFGFSDQGL